MGEGFGAVWLIIIICVLISMASNNKKKKAQQGAARPKAAPQTTAQAAAPQQQAAAWPPAVSKPATGIRPSVRVTPHDHSDMFAGSMGETHEEGYDPHDHGMAPVSVPSMHSDKALNESLFGEGDSEAVPASAVLPPLEGEQLVKAFVLQEILKRPSQR